MSWSDRVGKSVKRRKLVNDPKVIKEFVCSVPGPKQLAMEATRSWGLYYECVKEHVDQFHLGHPKKMKAITDSETKNNNTDADLIAKLTHSGFLPKAHVSSSTIRELRSLVRFRGYLVNQRRSVRNQIHTLIDRNVWPCHRPGTFKDLFCKRGRLWLKDLKLPERERFILDRCLDKFDALNKEISVVERYIVSQQNELAGLRYLRTTPGFRTGKVNAYVVLVEAGDITRFNKAKGFAFYAGLVPSEDSSGDKHRKGRLVKGANMHLRTALIESTFSAMRTDKGLRAYYLSVEARRGSGPAVIATARKPSYAIYHVLKEQRPYRAHIIQPPAADCHPFSTQHAKQRA